MIRIDDNDVNDILSTLTLLADWIERGDEDSEGYIRFYTDILRAIDIIRSNIV